MASSDEEGEIVSERVTSYYFVDDTNKVTSFSILPLQWNNNMFEDCSKARAEHAAEPVFLWGIVEDGHRKIYTKVVAWKLELSYVVPEIYVLPESKHQRWILLQKPKKSYEVTVRSVLISIHCLHFMKKNPEEESGEALWSYIRRMFGLCEVNNLMDHGHWITGVAMNDKDVAKSKMLLNFLHNMLGKRKSFHEEQRTVKKSRWKGYMDDEELDCYGDLSDIDKDESFDRVCAICDDGGDILSCEGRCIRSFHPTIKSGADSWCESLGYCSEQVDAMQTFLCQNCKYKQHQCFICGRLGCSDKSSCAEVFPCVSATCGHFYHPQCVSKIVFPGDENQARQFQKKIENGDSFTCPAHKCYVCKQGEDKSAKEMQFAVCRRCPKAYHRKCLPRSISFKRDDGKHIPQRAWEGLLANRILIYCMDHKIDWNVLTPKRDHLVFPDGHGKRMQHSSEVLPEKSNVMPERRSKAYRTLTDEIKIGKSYKETTGDFRRGDSVNKNEKKLTGKVPRPNASSSMIIQKNVATSDSMNDVRQSPWKSGKLVSKPSMRKVAEIVPTVHARTLRTAEMENRILRLMNECNSSINIEEFLEQRRKCARASSIPSRVDRTITMGMVECSVQAIQAALLKLQEGGTVEDAKAVCEPAILTQIIKWKIKLRVYLAPFIHGMRYTSFGRHFTKVDKLKEVVDRLRWYVQDGDTIVDFCCGSNDFSCLMKEELDTMGRNCYFKNFDLIQPKNDFNFEKRDWMSIRPEELPDGSKLIMGLNPPFGVESFLANQFINKALKFRPKLLVLIVPKETERLDEKTIPYDLIWKDGYILSGKSFYLPGSIDVHDQRIEQWNLEPPHLYLWSRPDWTTKHEEVAIEHDHLKYEDMDCLELMDTNNGD